MKVNGTNAFSKKKEVEGRSTVLTITNRGVRIAETLLYYGCRRSDKDYLYCKELAQFHQDGPLTQLNVAFSREQPHKVRPRGRGREPGLAAMGPLLTGSLPSPPRSTCSTY